MLSAGIVSKTGGIHRRRDDISGTALRGLLQPGYLTGNSLNVQIARMRRNKQYRRTDVEQRKLLTFSLSVLSFNIPLLNRFLRIKRPNILRKARDELLNLLYGRNKLGRPDLDRHKKIVATDMPGKYPVSIGHSFE